MRNKRLLSILIIVLMLLPMTVVITTAYTSSAPCTVRGYVYLDGETTTPEQVVLSFPGQDITATIPGDPQGYYAIDFNEDAGQTGTFSVTISSVTYTALETLIIQQAVYLYQINLTVTTQPNNPPDKPIDPSPYNNSENINLNPTISVYVNDPDNDQMNMFFYNAINHSLIDTDYNVDSGTRASITWDNLDYNTTYSWYVVANDSEFETTSDIFYFTTRTTENIPPEVEIVKPEQGTLYIFNRSFLHGLLRKTVIIGDITIEVNASDEDGYIEKVEFTIMNLFGREIKGNDTTVPYAFKWTRDRRRLFHLFEIKVTAYDNDGDSAEASLCVRKYL
jgi:hypothetical protein